MPWCKDNATEAECLANDCYWLPDRVPCQSCNPGTICETTSVYSCTYMGCFWYDDACHCDPSPNPENLTNFQECVDAGCYWYNGSCHSGLPVCEDIDFEDCANCLSCFGYDQPVVGGCYWYNGSCHTEMNPNPVSNFDEMLFACSDYDDAMYYCYLNMVNYYIPYAASKDFFNINTALINDCTHDNIHYLCKQSLSRGIFEAGHGTGHAISGQDGMVWATYDQMFHTTDAAGKIIYFLSCNTAISFGPWIVDTVGALAFAGFDGDTRVSTSQHFRECLGEFWIALCDGETVGDAYQRTLDKYDYWIAITGSANLAYNKEHFVVYGNMNARLLMSNITEWIDSLDEFTVIDVMEIIDCCSTSASPPGCVFEVTISTVFEVIDYFLMGIPPS